MARGSQHSTIASISHLIAFSLSVSVEQFRDVANRRGLGLDLSAIGSHVGAFCLQGGESFCLKRELVGNGVRLACRRSSSAARSLEIGDVLR
jgi:hypothetical protein